MYNIISNHYAIFINNILRRTTNSWLVINLLILPPPSHPSVKILSPPQPRILLVNWSEDRTPFYNCRMLMFKYNNRNTVVKVCRLRRKTFLFLLCFLLLLRSADVRRKTFLFLLCFLLFLLFFLIFLYSRFSPTISPLFLNRSGWNLACW